MYPREMRGRDIISWEIIAGLIAILGALISIMSVVVKVNATLTRLDEAVRQLREFIEDQERRNDSFSRTLASHETRLTLLERAGGEI